MALDYFGGRIGIGIFTAYVFREGSLYARAFPDTEVGITGELVSGPDGLDGRAALQRRAAVYPDPKNRPEKCRGCFLGSLRATALDERGGLRKPDTDDRRLLVHFYDGTPIGLCVRQNFFHTPAFRNSFWLELRAELCIPRFGLRTASLHVGSSATGSDHFLSGILYDADGTQTTCAGFELFDCSPTPGNENATVEAEYLRSIQSTTNLKMAIVSQCMNRENDLKQCLLHRLTSSAGNYFFNVHLCNLLLLKMCRK